MSDPKLVWTGYGGYTGWAHFGTRNSTSLTGDRFWHKAVRVAAEAEGGKIDAVQCYDAGILTAGPLQWTARFENLQRLLARCLEHDAGKFIKTVGPVMYGEPPFLYLEECKSCPHQYAIFRLDAPRKPLRGAAALRTALFGGGDGTIWTPRQKEMARRWVVALVALLRDPDFDEILVTEGERLLASYLSEEARFLIFVENGHGDQLAAAWLSFAINHPTGALAMLRAAKAKAPDDPLPKLLQLAASRLFVKTTFPARVPSVKRALAREFGVQIP